MLAEEEHLVGFYSFPALVFVNLILGDGHLYFHVFKPLRLPLCIESNVRDGKTRSELNCALCYHTPNLDPLDGNARREAATMVVYVGLSLA